ncbi:MAG: nucleoside recognition domain-containing protein [Pseudomonadota bacterium]
MNYVFYAIVLISYAAAAWNGTMGAVTTGAIEASKGAVTLAIGLVGIMALFLGLMEVMQQAGALRFIARMIRPVMVRLFPDVPPDHPAMAAMIMNLAANALGLANAATPFGIKAMQELDKLNGEKGTTTNAMALFLAINTSAVTLLPTGVIGLRASLGSANPAAILPSTLFASGCATLVGVLACKLYEKIPYFARSKPPVAREGLGLVQEGEEDLSRGATESLLPFVGLILAMVALVVLAILYGQLVSDWIIPTLIVGMLTVGKLRGVKVYEVFIAGAKDGFNVALRIIPYVVAILVAVAMFRESGALGLLVGFIGRFTAPFGLPAEALPMVLLRPLSGSGAYGVMADALTAYGTDTYVGYLVSTLQGSSETVFYVLAVYFGAVGVSRLRHSMFAALTADLAGVIGAVFICKLLFG